MLHRMRRGLPERLLLRGLRERSAGGGLALNRGQVRWVSIHFDVCGAV